MRRPARPDPLPSLAAGAAGAVRRVARTLTWRTVGLDGWHGGAVLVCWHGQIVLGAALLVALGRAGACLAPIVPEYGQGAAMRRFVAGVGLHPVLLPGYERPDERRTALEGLIPALRGGQSVFLAADGHRAPARVVARDPLWLAAAAGVPLLPVALAARRALCLPTWDRKLVPLPRTRVAVAMGAGLWGEATSEQVAGRLATQARQARLLLG